MSEGMLMSSGGRVSKKLKPCGILCPCSEGPCYRYTHPSSEEHECEICYGILRKSIELKLEYVRRRNNTLRRLISEMHDPS